MYALVDCNSFFASCERVFRPDLCEKPVAVMSNNDGCIVSRSAEVKALNIPMGQPVFKIRDILDRHKVVLFSANFKLYGALSNRVMATLSHFSSVLEVYSIDEAFLYVEDTVDTEALGVEIKETVERWTGIPVGVGFGKTKTLAKLSNYMAKHSGRGVFNIHLFDQRKVMATIPVSEVWGIGRKTAKMLARYNICSVLQFISCPEWWVRHKLHVPGHRIQLELLGISCLERDPFRPVRKQLLSSRSFGARLYKKEDIKGAVAANVVAAAEKLRRHQLHTQHVVVFISESRFKQGYYSRSVTLQLPEPTSSTPLLLSYAMRGVEMLYRSYCEYARAGVMFPGITPDGVVQQHLFCPQRSDKSVMEAVDCINERWGRQTIQPAIATWGDQPWKSAQGKVSPRYLTDWNALPVAYCC